MKTLTCIFSFVLLSAASFTGKAQDVPAKLNEALAAWEAGQLENARYALEEALNGINHTIGKEILDLLPTSMGDMAMVAEEDDATGTSMGIAGLFVQRNYRNGEKNASVEIVSDSPLLSGINTILSMPVIMQNDPNQKRIRLGNYKALMTRTTDDTGKVSWDIQMPFGSSLLTFRCSGIEDEATVTGLANTLQVEKIVAAAQ
ncbi:MAG TPA: hypothetical protein ENN63_08940 [Bacteroidetes bacterium]|nr:hypothetical protein [Bacteroidota bacterium]